MCDHHYDFQGLLWRAMWVWWWTGALSVSASYNIWFPHKATLNHPYIFVWLIHMQIISDKGIYRVGIIIVLCVLAVKWPLLSYFFMFWGMPLPLHFEIKYFFTCICRGDCFNRGTCDNCTRECISCDTYQVHNAIIAERISARQLLRVVFSRYAYVCTYVSVTLKNVN